MGWKQSTTEWPLHSACELPEGLPQRTCPKSLSKSESLQGGEPRFSDPVEYLFYSMTVFLSSVWGLDLNFHWGNMSIFLRHGIWEVFKTSGEDQNPNPYLYQSGEAGYLPNSHDDHEEQMTQRMMFLRRLNYLRRLHIPEKISWFGETLMASLTLMGKLDSMSAMSALVFRKAGKYAVH